MTGPAAETKRDISTVDKMNGSVLLVFWHGIGDCIISTPAFREFHNRRPNRKIFLGVNERVLASRFFEECDYVEGTFKISNPWFIDKDYKQAIRMVESEAEIVAKDHNIDEVITVSQYPLHGLHKITRTYRELGLGKVTNKKTEVYISEKDRKEAEAWLNEKNIKDFVFLHRESSLPEKDLPNQMADDFIRERSPGLPAIEPGIIYSIKNRPVGFSFAILEKARGIAVVDSAFLHAAEALGKLVDLGYFHLRPMVSEEVRPLNVRAHIVRGPNEKDLKRKIQWLVFIKPLMVVSGIAYGAIKRFR